MLGLSMVTHLDNLADTFRVGDDHRERRCHDATLIEMQIDETTHPVSSFDATDLTV